MAVALIGSKISKVVAKRCYYYYYYDYVSLTRVFGIRMCKYGCENKIDRHSQREKYVRIDKYYN